MIVHLPLVALLILSATACEREPRDARSVSAPASVASAAAPVVLVSDRSLVCMVNDQFMGRPQIPIAVNDRTYYGCCPACKDRLANDPQVRAATDPVSSKPVDKAVAVIGQTASGATLYFENELNLEAYSRQLRAN
jgi:YHS domain-containing protein